MSERRREVEMLLLTMFAAVPLYATQTISTLPLLLFHLALAALRRVLPLRDERDGRPSLPDAAARAQPVRSRHGRRADERQHGTLRFDRLQSRALDRRRHHGRQPRLDEPRGRAVLHAAPFARRGV